MVSWYIMIGLLDTVYIRPYQIYQIPNIPYQIQKRMSGQDRKILTVEDSISYTVLPWGIFCLSGNISGSGSISGCPLLLILRKGRGTYYFIGGKSFLFGGIFLRWPFSSILSDIWWNAAYFLLVLPPESCVLYADAKFTYFSAYKPSANLGVKKYY